VHQVGCVYYVIKMLVNHPEESVQHETCLACIIALNFKCTVHVCLIFQSALKELLARDSFYAPEVEIFRAVCEWVQANPDEDADDILRIVRLPLMSLPELLGIVRPAGLVSPDTILDAIQARTQAKDSELNYRGCLSEYFLLYWAFC
jgi:hypothetical protein